MDYGPHDLMIEKRFIATLKSWPNRIDVWSCSFIHGTALCWLLPLSNKNAHVSFTLDTNHCIRGRSSVSSTLVRNIMGRIRWLLLAQVLFFVLLVCNADEHETPPWKFRSMYDLHPETIDKMFADQDSLHQQYDEYVAEIDDNIKMINNYHENLLTSFEKVNTFDPSWTA